ncbi:hypothetical protein [Alteromonas halophila]|uniref:Integrase n=1 Tax=Alteromonas halophila TaxID=516698 RepID=A0A918JQL5_9ALTE|nr:hypothetical protein [Alteromonas halophila]GGW98157.1 hypothetical protein GCM10007391_35080 [Alteromonas halophila]
MPKFAKPETQAKNVIKELTKSKVIRSLGTARSYKQALQNVAKWVKANKLNGLHSIKPEQARFYLERRAEEVGQKTVDMERQAIQAMMQVNGKLQPNESLYCVKSELPEIKSSRAYTAQQASAISDCQNNNHRLATQIAYAAGL